MLSSAAPTPPYARLSALRRPSHFRLLTRGSAPSVKLQPGISCSCERLLLGRHLWSCCPLLPQLSAGSHSSGMHAESLMCALQNFLSAALQDVQTTSRHTLNCALPPLAHDWSSVRNGRWARCL